MNSAYSGFAGVYDEFMDDIDYEAWADCIIRLLRVNGIRDGLVLDLGCGTGTMTGLLSRAGYDMIGVDGSAEMLSQAAAKEEGDGRILYLCQQMQEFELYGTVRAVVSVCDVINYLLTEEDLLQVFRLVNNYLDPGGLFIFDMNTPYKYAELMGDAVIAENREDSSFIWENDFDPETGINEYALTLFLRREDGLYEKEEELHTQRAWPEETVLRLLKEAGMKLLSVHEAYTDKAPGPDTQRLTFVAMEQGKTQGTNPCE